MASDCIYQDMLLFEYHTLNGWHSYDLIYTLVELHTSCIRFGSKKKKKHDIQWKLLSSVVVAPQLLPIPENMFHRVASSSSLQEMDNFKYLKNLII